jgi:uncharacterized membrane protein YfcA
VNWLRVAAGALTGLSVGVTGVGGGALMTPLLLLVFGTAPATAIGTDLIFAAATKAAIAGIHQRQRLIDWTIVVRLWCGSLTAAGATLLWMRWQPVTAESADFLRGAIAVAVCVTAVGMIAQRRLQSVGARIDRNAVGGLRRWQAPITVAAGAVLGALVTLTSVGAGALGAVFLLYLYPSRLTPPRLIATDVVHAIPLALFAGIGHLLIGNVDPRLLRDLLVGSIPAAVAGAYLSSRLPHVWLRWLLSIVLLLVGFKLLADTWLK